MKNAGYLNSIPNDENITFKIATEEFEISQIHNLNYETFVVEVPQHSDKTNKDRLLVDRFHDENTYIIALKEAEVIGMVAIRGSRPFSLDEKIPNLDNEIPEKFYCPSEVRLLSIKPEYRKNTRLALRLLKEVFLHGVNQGFDIGLISGKSDKLKLYEYIGFKKFGPPVISNDVEFQPMYCRPQDSLRYFIPTKKFRPRTLAYFSPGPVNSYDEANAAFDALPISHRSKQFMNDFAILQSKLCKLLNVKYVQLMTGCGTLANDIIAGQLSLQNERGLILTHGEFSERLAKQARAYQLEYVTLSKPWGTPFSEKEIKDVLNADDSIRWIWTVHCETSTGMLNDLSMLKKISQQYHLKLCLDCISSIGAVPVDLSNVFLASGSSAKAIGAMAGICFVAHNEVVEAQPLRLPRVLDLGYYMESNGIPYTIPTKLVYGLLAALEQIDANNTLERTKRFAKQLRMRLKELDIDALLPASSSSPAIVTVELPLTTKSMDVGQAFEKAGILISYGSNYLRSRNWVQFALMGNYNYEDFARLLENLEILKYAENSAVSVG